MENTHFEIARIIGARALQLAMGAPMLIKKPADVYDPTDIAKRELDTGVLPMTVKRPMPQKIEAE